MLRGDPTGIRTQLLSGYKIKRMWDILLVILCPSAVVQVERRDGIKLEVIWHVHQRISTEWNKF